MTLALFGGKPAVDGGLAKYNSIGGEEVEAAKLAVSKLELSGFLGGLARGGPAVQMLEERWAQKFGVTFAIACNSATSGLLAAASCMRTGAFNVSPYTMSATAAAPALLRHMPYWVDIDPMTFNMNPDLCIRRLDTVVTNLFGLPADLHKLRQMADESDTLLIEDNAQSPLAKVGDRYAGTIGHIGVFSLNVHKHIQCGEGGVVVTDDRLLADKIRGFINHGEMASQGLGLNLRMTEYTAAIALSQLNKIEQLVRARINQAVAIEGALQGIDWLKAPRTLLMGAHVYYTVPFRYTGLGVPRKVVAAALQAEGFPMVEGYVNPLYNLPAFPAASEGCAVAERMYREELLYFENCAWSPTDEQIEQFADACRKVEANIGQLRRVA